MGGNERPMFYRFRPLATKLDFYRLKETLQTGKFWCSKFSELNDPMEGIFITFDPEYLKLVDIKEDCRICSFSGKTALTKPCMWGYYANGFRGVAIGINVVSENVYKENQDKQETPNENVLNKMHKIDYRKDILQVSTDEPTRKVGKILTAKLPAWKHECEYRFLTNHEQYKIGDIKCLVFGAPYLKCENFEQTVKGSASLRRYYKYVIKIANFVKVMEEKQKIMLRWAASNDGKKVEPKPLQGFEENFKKILHIYRHTQCDGM